MFTLTWLCLHFKIIKVVQFVKITLLTFVCDNLKNYLKNKQKKTNKNKKHLDLQSQREPFMVLTFGLGSKKLRCYTAWTADTTTANISHTQQTDLALCVRNVTPQHFNNTI